MASDRLKELQDAVQESKRAANKAADAYDIARMAKASQSELDKLDAARKEAVQIMLEAYQALETARQEVSSQ